MTVLDIPEYTDISLDYGDVFNQIIYYDDNMIVILTDADLSNSKVNTSIVSYYKKSNKEYEKICELRVPRSPLSSSSVTGYAKNLDEQLDDSFQLNLNQNQHYTVINWADEISYEEPTNIPDWALIPGVDFDLPAKNDSSITENIDNFNQTHHKFVSNWAEEPAYDGPVHVPEWALIPGLDFDRHAQGDCPKKHCFNTENSDDFDKIHHQYIINWADEPVYDGPVDVPDWALIPGFNFNTYCQVDSDRVTDLDSDAKDCVNRQRSNAKSYFMDTVSGLSTIWE